MQFKSRDTDRNSAHTNREEKRATRTMEDRLSGDAISDRRQQSKTPPDPSNPHALEGVRNPEDFHRAPLSGTAAREQGSERRKRMFRISRIAAGSGSRQANSGWWSQRDLNPCLKMTATSPFIFLRASMISHRSEMGTTKTRRLERHTGGG